MPHLISSSYDRGAIENLHQLGDFMQRITDGLGFAKSTIHYERQRVRPYNAHLAQADTNSKRCHCGRKPTLTAENKQKTENQLKLTWSPETITYKLNLATSTIYDWLNKGRLRFSLSDLPHRNVYQQRKNETRGTFKVEQSIENRPEEVNQRKDFGHWEVDTVLSSRIYWAIKAPNRTKESMNIAFKRFMNSFGITVKSITVDHGTEFSGYRELKDEYKLSIYFCHAYSPWERASNELFNRKLRYLFSKKSNFREIDEQRLYEALDLINNRPMKRHNYRTPIEVLQGCSN
ncbi:IS30 family (Tra8) [Fructobacillus fructosus]|uniref:IS30 family transposase n=1 Tax=Fructobacillus fructosus TaxID=1631 RepID=UPI002D9B68AB|nr:IS30 family (Tra8) [Fructobacillus fructosus]